MDNKERFIEIFTSQIHRPGAAELLEWLESTDFFEAPASTHYHGSYTGGLVEHSLNVYYELIGAGRVPGVPTAETYAVVALLHDICKADFYAQSTKNQKNSDGKWETVPCYTVREKFPFGHGEKSAFLVQRFMPLTDAEALAIRWHMGRMTTRPRVAVRFCPPLWPQRRLSMHSMPPICGPSRKRTRSNEHGVGRPAPALPCAGRTAACRPETPCR